MTGTRRAFLRGGGAALAAAAVGIGARTWQTAVLPGVDEPCALWTEWPKLPWPSSMIAAGVLAASPHNSQPWRFHPHGPAIDLRIDERRALGPVDPFLRQMWLGAGCALENMVAAGLALGRALGVTLLPDPITAARLLPGKATAARPELIEVISRRHTNRGPYHRDRPVPRALTDALVALSSHPATRLDLFARDEPPGIDFAADIVDATRALIADTTLIRASDAWFRHTPREEAEHRDGPSLRCAGLPAWKRLLATLGPRTDERAAHEGWLALTEQQHCGTAASFGAISVRDAADRAQLLEAGRLWQRIQLLATAHGLGFQPLDQLLELADRERELGLRPDAEPRLARLTDASFRPVMTFRLGWPQRSAPASARRGLPSFLVG